MVTFTYHYAQNYACQDLHGARKCNRSMLDSCTFFAVKVWCWGRERGHYNNKHTVQSGNPILFVTSTECTQCRCNHHAVL